MESKISGTPQALKQVNLSAVRKIIRERGSATRAEIAQATGISTTTVRTLLTEMLLNREIAEFGLDESMGGRKAVRYELMKDRFLGVALCLAAAGAESRYLTVNLCGEIVESGVLPVCASLSESIFSFLDRIFSRLDIRAIGIGVPGIVRGLTYRNMNAEGRFEEHEIGKQIRERYQVPVILENDLNAIVLGFGRRYLKQFPGEKCGNVHMAYLHFSGVCLSAGFLSEGRILRGWNNFGGELGLFPVQGAKTLDTVFTKSMGQEQFVGTAVKVLSAVCCILNPQYIALGGEGFCEAYLTGIAQGLRKALPEQMVPELVFAKDSRQDHDEGIAYLTSEQIFSGVKLIEE